MSTGDWLYPATSGGPSGDAEANLEWLVESLWREFNGRAARRRIGLLVHEAAAGFADATVTRYVPIFIVRRVRWLLQEEMLAAERGT